MNCFRTNKTSYMVLTIMLLINSTYGIDPDKSGLLEWEDSTTSVLFYPDNETDADQYDLFYDRIVAITLFENNDESSHKNIAIGVLLDKDRVLTSYNPFREPIKNRDQMTKTKLIFLSSRKSYTSEDDGLVSYYGTITRHISCARPLIPMEDKHIQDEQWHGPDKKYCPLHDLSILRADGSVRLGELGNKSDVLDLLNRKNEAEEVGPIITKIATRTNQIGRDLKFVSLGLTDYEPISLYQTLRFAIYDQSDLVDCNSWLPKNWGYFICLKNNPNFIGFASSAMLFSNETLFGVGSFTLWRGATSILVFTDVRPYGRLISNACNDDDLKLLRRTHG